jgi:L-proline amide hydrolase
VVDRLHLVEVPSLVLSGRYDEATPELQRPLVERIGQVEQIVFEDSSHQPFWEERDRYMAVVGDWLARHD